MKPIDVPETALAERIGRAAAAFELQRTGHAPASVSVVLSGDTLVVTLHGALSPAERALTEGSPEGAAKVREFHRQLFATSSGWLRREIKRITGVDVREAAAEVDPGTGAVVGVFKTGTTVQVFLMAEKVPGDAWTQTTPCTALPDEPAVPDGL